MNKEIFLIFPNQLWAENRAFLNWQIKRQTNGHKNIRKIFMIEDSLFFGDKRYPAKFHKQKLAYHRATMKSYKEYLLEKGYEVKYLDYSGESLDKVLEKEISDVQKIHVVNSVDFLLEKRLQKLAENFEADLVIYDSPGFLNTHKENQEYLEKNKGKNYRMQSFYIWQRKRLGILLNKDETPEGGKWSFDAENRKKLPKNLLKDLPELSEIKSDKHWKEAVRYVEKNFSKNYGELSENPIYPTNYADSKKWLKKFLKERFEDFGSYEDAVYSKNHTLYHSVLTPMLNVGLLTPKEIVDEVLKFSEEKKISLNSLEGFIRQIIGWREFMRLVYVDGGPKIRNGNIWNHKNKIPETLYTGETGILPIDDVIKELLKTGYCHHIERLMILGNFMFLCQIDPDEIYKWFMEMFIDSYDWVMVPNVYGMSQNAVGDLMTTKPYISGSNYVLKMSHYEKDDWCEIWDALYWNFIIENEKELRKNPRMSLIASRVSKFKKEKISEYKKIKEDFLKKLYN